MRALDTEQSTIDDEWPPPSVPASHETEHCGAAESWYERDRKSKGDSMRAFPEKYFEL